MPARSFGWGVLIPLVCFAGCQILSGGSELHTSPTTHSVTTSSSGPSGSGGSGGDGGQGGVNAGGQGGGPDCKMDCPDGSPCSIETECLSGFCADGVCCDTACDGECERCTAPPNGDSSTNGTCSFVPEGFDPERECSGADVCNGNGSCASLCDVTPIATEPNNCPPQCTGGCGGGTCQILCSSGECTSAIITCPAGMDCDVSCNGDNKCSQLTLFCPDVYRCTVICIGANACFSSNIIGATGYLDMICGGIDATVCAGAAVSCGHGPCQVNCTGQSVNNPPNIIENETCNTPGKGCMQ